MDLTELYLLQKKRRVQLFNQSAETELTRFGSFSEESSVEGSWMMRNDTLQTPGALQTPQLTSTVLRENRPAEHMPDPDSEPGSENDYVHKWVHAHTHMHICM